MGPGENILPLCPDLGPHILLGLWHRILSVWPSGTEYQLMDINNTIIS